VRNVTPGGDGKTGKQPLDLPIHRALHCHAKSSHKVCRCQRAAGGAPKGHGNAWKHGLYSADAMATGRLVREMARAARETLRQ
jgi:hypothetical protein